MRVPLVRPLGRYRDAAERHRRRDPRPPSFPGRLPFLLASLRNQAAATPTILFPFLSLPAAETPAVEALKLHRAARAIHPAGDASALRDRL